MEMYYVLLLFIATMVFWIFLELFYSKRYTYFIKSFLNANSNITILYENNKISFINSIGLEFFSVSSFKEFNKSYSDLSQLFLPAENCMDKHTYGKKWFDIVKNNNSKYIKVKLFSKRDNMNYYFNINISKLKNNNYLLSLNDITKLESEKVIIKKEAEYDLLTEVYNRVKFNKVLKDMIYKANKYDFKFSIILLDIDHFKHINDTHGHNIGDKVLIELSRLINMYLREEDIFARWGGEEFVILSESANVNDVSRLALRLRNIVNEHLFAHIEKLTCSFGVTEFKIGDTQSLLFERVDKALYEAKHNGRNQVVTK